MTDMAKTVQCPYCQKALEPEGSRYPNHLDARDAGLCDLSGLNCPDSTPSGPASTASEAARREADFDSRRKSEKQEASS